MRLINLNLEPGRGLPENAVYIGRAHAARRLPASKFANPFPLLNRTDEDERKQILERYRHWLWGEIQAQRITVTDLQALEGHDLACFCVPQLCHGMVVQNAVAWARGQKKDQDWRGVPNPIPAPQPRTLSDWLKPRP